MAVATFFMVYFPVNLLSGKVTQPKKRSIVEEDTLQRADLKLW